MAGHPELDSISNSMAQPRQSSNPKIPQVIHKMTIERHSPTQQSTPTTPGSAISHVAGGYKVNDLNPSNGIQNFGTSPTHEQALKHLRAIEYFKHGGQR